MKIKVEKTITEEIEIEFPLYVKDSCHYWYLKGEKEFTGVTIIEGYSCSIHTGVHFPDYEEIITKEEFDSAFDKAVNILKESINKL